MPLKEEFITYSFQEEGIWYVTKGHTGKEQGQSAGRGSERR